LCINLSNPPLIIWSTGGVPGKVHDTKLNKISHIDDYLDDNEFLLADSDYQGNPLMIVPYKGKNLTENQKDFNSVLSQKRVIVENIFAKIKIFNCLLIPWRNDIHLHHTVWNVICHVTNLKLKFL